MTNLTIYAHYGVLAHEKQPVYSPFGTPGALCDALTVEIPFQVWNNIEGMSGVTIDGVDYLLYEVLTNSGDKPAIRWYDGHKTQFRVLKVINN